MSLCGDEVRCSFHGCGVNRTLAHAPAGELERPPVFWLARPLH